ncbi:waprin-Enh1-like [Rhineura floridana]|uniref:waprin-Enh1-like n=1 Tax=Rhineura floridana TaxID=261503 RepID=UPI002AC7EE1C|nr:waprin-Enh1-like [Rhineura floridana]
MKTLGVFLLVSILVVCLEMPTASGTSVPKEKPGSCPVVTVRCRMLNPPNQCNSDSECPSSKKCCEGICGKECMPPVSGTLKYQPGPAIDTCTMKTTSISIFLGLLALWTQLPSASCILPRDKLGTCPPNPFRCTVPGKDICSIDYDCPGYQKCCAFNCNKICRDPLPKPGLCPVFDMRCLSLNPPNKCNSDFDCFGEKKCCEGTCGRDCFPPIFV